MKNNIKKANYHSVKLEGSNGNNPQQYLDFNIESYKVIGLFQNLNIFIRGSDYY